MAGVNRGGAKPVVKKPIEAIQDGADARDQAARQIVKLLGARIQDNSTQLALAVLMDRKEMLSGEQLMAVAILMEKVSTLTIGRSC